MLQELYSNISTPRRLLIKAGIVLGFALTTLYLIFRAYYINFTPILAAFSVLLFMAELHTIILMFGMLYSLWPRKYKTYSQPNLNRDLQINMFVTVAGEPTEVVKETIEHAKAAADYYNRLVQPNSSPRVIVLNDGKAAKKANWQEVEQICQSLGVYHVARETNEGFKAGNINNGIKQFPASDPHNTIDCFFDSDFCAEENFLPEILKPLVDESVDFVQSPQRYKNLITWVAKAAGAHQIFFFDYICPAKAYDNALFLCGTNYAIRRKAILSAGGIDNRFVTEDYATSIRLHLNGNKGVFIPTVLAYGMAPMNLKEYFNQQTRWCKGCLDANGRYFNDLFLGKLTRRQKFHYFLSTAYYFIGVRDLILVLAPVPYLFWGISLIRANTIQYLGLVYLPLIIYNFTLFFITFRNPVKSLVLDLVAFPVFALAFMSSVLKHNLPFTITIKKYEKENPFRVYKIQLGVALLLLTGLTYSLVFSHIHTNIAGRMINYFWATYDAMFLLIGFYLVLRENLSLNLKLRLPKLPSVQIGPVKYAYAVTRVVIALTVITLTGLAIPVVYGAAKNQYVEITTNPYLVTPARGAYYGYYQPELNSQPENPQIKLFEGDSPSLAMYYQDWRTASMFNTRFMKQISDQKAIPVITWEPADSQYQDAPINQPGKPQELITSGVYDEYIRTWAKAAKDYKKPFFLRFAHEMNGNWYPWANDPESYKRMWIHVHDIFAQVGATNVIWVWSPNNTNQLGETTGVMNYYPGDQYVDWTGYSAFNWGNGGYKTEWHTFNFVSYAIYNELSNLNKPIMVSETSSVSQGGDKTGWFYQTLGTYIPQMPNIKAVIIFDQDFGNADFSLDSGIVATDIVKHNIMENDYYLKQPVIEYK
jgi:cellulose synthase (UDP-forming)